MKIPSTFRLTIRMFHRDWRAGELTVLGVALVLAVASLTSVGFLTDRVEQALKLESNRLLGGDLLLTADRPWDQKFRTEANSRGLRLAESVSFPSMVTQGDTAQLADIKAVSEGYPLRGNLRAAPELNAPDAVVTTIPQPGEAWPDERLATALALKPGVMVELGRHRPLAGPVLTMEPDRGMNVFALAPRLLINLADLPKTGLIQQGSRVVYRLHVAGERSDIVAFEAWATEQLGRGQKLESLDNARPEVRSVIERAQRFLRLAALLAVVLAGVAVALSAERYLRRHLDGCAVMRCMGASEAQLLVIHGGEFLLFGFLATLLGGALGYAVQELMIAALTGLLIPNLPAPSLLPWLHGFLVGLVLVAGFALPPLLRLKSVPTIRVLRREWDDTGASSVFAYVVGATALSGLMIWIAGEWRMGLVVIAGFTVALAVYVLAAQGLLMVLGQLRPAGNGYGWRHGLANLRRHHRATLIQSAALGLGLTALLLLTVARGDLLENWRMKSPPDGPNRFAINIQPEQLAPIRDFFRTNELAEPRLQPMVRGRLVTINGETVVPTDFADERARRLVDREFNLSWSNQLPEGNTVSGGAFHGEVRGTDLSVEQGLAETLNLRLGDKLAYEIAGRRFEGTVTSLRKLEWDSMRVNFFVLAADGELEKFPASYITSFHLPHAKRNLAVDLVRAFPNLTLIDTAALVEQAQATLNQVSQAVQLIFGFAVLAGIAVLYAALQASGDERRQELAVLRALGAQQRQLTRALLAEFAVLGALAGLLAGVGASLIGWTLARFVFRLDYLPNPSLWLVGMAVGIVLVSIAGWLGASGILRQPALPTLRAAS